MTGPECLQKPSVVPWVAIRQDERAAPANMLSVLPNGKGLCYVREEKRDRDDRGVLWGRCSHALGDDGLPAGRPDFRMMHPSRQRDCMAELRCQVCYTQRASKTRDGYLFVLAADDVNPDGLEGTLTHQPPLCLEHAGVSARSCPVLRQGFVALRSRVPRLYGVNGYLYGHRHGQPIEVHAERRVPYTDRQLTPWILAGQLVRRLTRVTVIDLEEELASAGCPGPAADRGHHRVSRTPGQSGTRRTDR
jgi:hypothetical protein